MAVIVGSARIDENGKAYGGKAGDQTGKEVSTQNWYKHSKGWIVLRAKDPVKADKIAECMRMACTNSHIGYDQWQRNTLYDAAKPFNFDVSKVEKNVECDCSSLVRVCMAYAGIFVDAFRTGAMPSVLGATGCFLKLTDSKYTDKSDYLKTGDILVTKTSGHTVVVLSDGAKATKTPTLRKGAKGDAVKRMQELLLAKGETLLKYGADGSFGAETLAAVRSFQRNKKLVVDGICGVKTWAALMA